ncbi:MAG TPA: 1,4-alpha-glucan branching protein GlgB [Actinomycetota bacterium]|nr:1,4-alpha-glucan branching protein GlgB [Actinomycetota bacterium]
MAAREARETTSPLTDDDIYLFNEGTHYKLGEKLGSHMTQGGTHFGVWAPNAERVSLIGDFNGWDDTAHPMSARGGSGIWETFVEGIGQGSIYKYRIHSRHTGYRVDKADPFAVHHETPPKTGSIVWDDDYTWNDGEWMAGRGPRGGLASPMSTYEVHLGSWRRAPEDGNRSLSYRELAGPLADYVEEMGFTHVELMPVTEHPFYGSWGYQASGYFAPTARYGTPQDFKHLVDTLHQRGIGVILDWVPSHFPSDEHGLGYFDGTHLFEHADPRQGFHPDWESLIFNYGRNEVRAFLMSSAIHWLDRFHIDGLRVDAVASMLYLDYSRKDGEWIPNEFGGRENLEAIAFLRRFNEDVYTAHPDVQTIAEESTAWPMVSRPTYVGGLGFGLKWDMGWMHDTLEYFKKDPVHRRFHQHMLTFRSLYAWQENFVLPLSHDEVVHGKGSLLGKMPGDEWQQFANLRALYGLMYATPGKKLLFMGAEFGQRGEWNHEASLDWHVLDYELHAGVQRLVRELNRMYRSEPALHEMDAEAAGFEWVDASDAENSVIASIRRGRSTDDLILVAANLTPVPRHNYILGVPRGGQWREILNTDAREFGGSGQGNAGGKEASPVGAHGRPRALTLTLPPLSVLMLKSDERR